MRFRVLAVVAVSLLLVTGCVGTTRRVEVGREMVNDPTSTNIQDFQTIAQRMARSMVQLPQIQNATQPPTIAFLSVENRSNEFIDKNAFLEKMRTLLLKNANGRVTFLDRAHTEELLKEKRAKERGQLTSSTQGTTLYGADYFLTGTISSINAAGGSDKTIYKRYAFRLTSADSGAILWEDDYETQIFNRRGFLDR